MHNLKRFKKLELEKDAPYSGRFISVFPGTLSSRMYLKCMNDICQQVLEKYTEPFSVLSWLSGGKYDSDI